MSVYSSYSDWLTALGGTYTRASNASYYNSSGTLSTASTNALRFDYNPDTHAAKGILLEGARTNICTYSAAFNSWTASNATVTPNSATSPDGTANASTLAATADSGGVYNVTAAGASSTTYTGSCYFKANTSTTARLEITNDNESAVSYANFTLSSSGSVGAVTDVNFTGGVASIVSIGSGWYRCSITATSPGSGMSNVGLFIRVPTNGQSVYAFGAQLEVGSFASSYIPTTSASATRAADKLTFPTSPWFNSSAGTLFAEISLLAAQSGYPRLVCIHDGTSNNYIAFVNINSLTSQQFEVYVGGVAQATIARAITGTADKYISAFATNDFAHATNGTLGTPDASGSVPAVTSFNAIAVPGGSAGFVWIRKIGYWPFRVTNAELQRLTT